MTASIRIEVEHRLPVSVRDGFDYITDPTNWPEYWPRLVRITSAKRWREPGDRACLVLRVLRREVELEMKPVRIEPSRLVEYTSEQRGLPAAPRWLAGPGEAGARSAGGLSLSPTVVTTWFRAGTAGCRSRSSS